MWVNVLRCGVGGEEEKVEAAAAAGSYTEPLSRPINTTNRGSPDRRRSSLSRDRLPGTSSVSTLPFNEEAVPLSP